MLGALYEQFQVKGDEQIYELQQIGIHSAKPRKKLILLKTKACLRENSLASRRTTLVYLVLKSNHIPLYRVK